MTSAKDRFEVALERFEAIIATARFDDARPPATPDRVFADKALGLKMAYPGDPWIRGGYELGDLVVPGYVLRIWSAPSESGVTDDGKTPYATRLALFLQFPGKPYTAQQLIDLSVPGLENALGADMIEQEVRSIAGQDAMWLVVEGNSKSGSNLTGKGKVRTRQVWVAIPRKHDGVENIVVLLLSTPAADYAQRAEQFTKLLDTLEISKDSDG